MTRIMSIGSTCFVHSAVLLLLLLSASCDVKPVQFFTVTAEKPEGGAIVLSKGSGINCGDDCHEAFVPGTEITIKAEAAPGWFFRRWEGECSEQRATCKFILSRNAQVFAVFRRDEQTSELAVQIVSNAGALGTVTSNPEGLSCPDSCFSLFPKDRRVRLDANPAALSQFERWEGSCTSTTPSCFVRLNSDKYVSAVFAPRQVTLTVEAPEDGRIVSSPAGIDCIGTCSATFIAGTSIQLSATPDSEAEFKEWKGACSGAETTCQLTLNTSTVAGADFLGLRDVNIQFSGGGSGTVLSLDGEINCERNCTTRYLQGTEVTLGASARFGSQIVGWQTICSGPNDCTFVVEDDTDIELSVKYVDFDLSVTRVGSGVGRVVSVPEGIDCGGTCTTTVSYLTRVSLTAQPEPGTEFAGWAGICQGASRVCLLTMTGATNVNAYFIPQFTLAVTTQGLGRGVIRSNPAGIDCDTNCEGYYSRDSMVTLSAEPYRGSYFMGWGGACSGIGECAVTLDQPLNVDAAFGLLDYRIYAAVAGTGVGTVTSTSVSIDCPGDLSRPWHERQGQCSAVLPFGTAVTFRAQSNAGSRFVGWKGANCPSGDRCTVTVDGERTIHALFEPMYTLISPGEYIRGSPPSEPSRASDEGPQLPIAISRGLWYKSTEVTVGEWMRLMGSAPNPSLDPLCREDCPIQGVTWDDAVRYLNALSDSEELEHCYWKDQNRWIFSGLDCAGYRLPTEAEWEMAARAGGTEAFATGGLDNSADVCVIESSLSLLGWYCGNTVTVRNVARLNPNAFGLYDMHGNVAEWTNDVYDANYYVTNITNLSDPPGPSSTSTTGPEIRTVRGGAFSDYANNCRSAKRLAVDSSTRSASIGFRPVRSNYTYVPPGAFLMGSESTEAGHQPDEAPPHWVVHSRPYLIGRTEVTQVQWRAYFSSNPNPSFFSSCGADCPVEMISYNDAIAYVNTLSNAAGLVPCYAIGGSSWVSQSCSGYRLPTESEWERAARAGETGALTGGTPPTLTSGCTDPSSDSLGWYCYNGSNMTHPVGQKQANAWGLFDVHGNVSEWVSDWYDAAYYSTSGLFSIDPIGPSVGTERVARGGSWASPGQEIRFASRGKNSPALTLLQVGMRSVKEVCPAANFGVLSLTNPPSARSNMSVSRLGDEIMVFGGLSVQDQVLDSGSIHNVHGNNWRSTPALNAPSSRHKHSATWTGKELVVWGGTSDSQGTSGLSSGARYSPAVDVWSVMTASVATPSGRYAHEMVWTGSEVIIWGGYDGQFALNDGARYLPESDTWIRMSESPLSTRYNAASVWTGEEMFVFGGLNSAGTCTNTYATYNPKTDQWSSSRANGAGCGCASEAYLVSEDILVVSDSGWCQYNLATSQWTQLPPRPGNRIMAGPAAVAAGVSPAELFVFGGSTQASDGVLDAYSPKGQVWRTSAVFSPNIASSGATAQWVGCGLWAWSSTGVGSNSYFFVP
jgi:formylglycine-generating enzyme required for sulfatase activity